MAKNNNPGRILKGTKTQPSLKGASGIWTLDEALQYHRANQWPIPNLYQPVSNSVRNSLAKTSYFTFTPNRTGSNRRFTMSWWFKLGQLSAAGGTQRHLFYSYDGSNLLQVFLERASGTNPDYICFYGGGTDLRFSPILRDTNAWYHLVISVDINQSTSSNTVKGWLNGVQMTMAGSQASSTPTYPTGSTYWPIFQPYAYQRVGGNSSGGTFDGYFSEVNFIDGYALQPSLFGQFDSNNTWVPIPYTGSYGTNGFYLPFTNAQTSQTLGYDASLNGTPTYSADQDPYRSSVTMHFDGNGFPGSVGTSTNTLILDSSSNNYTITTSGSVSQGSFSPYPFAPTSLYNPIVHGGSAYFQGTSSSYLTVPSSSNWAIGSTGTIEMWVYPTANNAGNVRFWCVNNNSSGLDAYFNGGATTVYMHGGAVGTTTSMSLNTWTHLAVVYNSGTVSIYFNGISQTLTGTTTGYNITNNGTLYIGNFNAPATGYAYTGYMSGVRITKGVAIYTGNFVPTNRPFGTLTNNLITFSEDFTNSFWIPYNLTVTTGAGIAPDGTPTATLVTSTQVFSNSNIAFSYSSTSNSSPYTYSIYAKAGTLYSFRHRVAFTGGTGLGYSIDVNLQTGTYQTGESGYTNASIASVGNGWYRISITASNNGTGNTNYIGQCYLGSLQGTSTGSIYIWGAQYEQSSSLSTYTPTPANYSTTPSLLLTFATAAIVDVAGANNATPSGIVSITSNSKNGAGAITFNGSTDYLTLNGSTGTTYFGTNNFTVECWWQANGTQTNYAPIISQGFTSSPPSGTWGLKVAGASTTNLQFTYDAGLVNVGQNINSSINPNDGNWHHLAVSRNSSTLNMYIDGILVGNASIPASEVVGNTTTPIIIGYESRDGSYLKGTIDDLRVTNGVGRYPSAFSPPARSLPNIGGKSFVAQNINAGVVQKFTTVGTNSWTAPSDVTQVEVLVVAGGGGGGSRIGGGGGAGGLIYNSQYPVTPGQTYTVTVGAGGSSATSMPGTQGGNGGNSVFGNLTAIGGGGGGYYNTSSATLGSSGGSAGGNGGYYTNSGTSGTAGQGFSGGGSTASQDAGGGGGGAGGSGATGVSGQGGAGGTGLQFSISGIPTYYAGGGGGGQGTSAGAGGSGGGGAGSTSNNNATAGTANTGGGGGGARNSSDTSNVVSGAGGSGIVLIRYTTTAVANTSDLTTDNLLDSPTLYGHDLGNGGEVVGNYATWNPLDNFFSGDPTSAGVVWQNSNLTIANNSASWLGQRATIAYPSSGKYYYEVHIDSGSGPGVSSGVEIGITQASSYPAAANTYIDNTASTYCYRLNGSVYTAGSLASSSVPTFNIGDTIGVAFDAGALSLTFYKNGVSVYSAITVAANTYIPAISTYAVVSVSTNFGQRPWAYSPPAGYSALTTKNLPRPAIPQPNQYFDVVTYTGNGSTQTVTLPGGFQPDMIWIKNRSTNAVDPVIMDSVRGSDGTHYYVLDPASINNEAASGASWYGQYGYLSAITTTGFTVVNGSTTGNYNTSANNYIAWCWKKGALQGFDIQTYTSGGSTDTITHALGATPAMIIVKSRSSSSANWWMYHVGIGTGKSLQLNSTNAYVNDTWVVNSSTVQYNYGIASGQTAVMYLWAAVPGFSAFGSYAANGSADGPFVYTGFKPRWIMMKRYDTGSAENWFIVDTARDPGNYGTGQHYLLITNAADGTGTAILDVLSNGFKLRSTATNAGSGGPAYIYAAFASNPFQNNNGTAF